jgi:hypothetical protein
MTNDITNDVATWGASGGHADLTFLAGYAHVASCPDCRQYAFDYLDLADGQAVLAATLAHHDSAHASDPMTLANQHFA